MKGVLRRLLALERRKSQRPVLVVFESEPGWYECDGTLLSEADINTLALEYQLVVVTFGDDVSEAVDVTPAQV